MRSVPPPEKLIVPLTIAPLLSTKVPALIVAASSFPPEKTKACPPLLIVAPLAVPPAKTSTAPPLLTLTPLAVPPEATSSEMPLLTT